MSQTIITDKFQGCKCSCGLPGIMYTNKAYEEIERMGITCISQNFCCHDSTSQVEQDFVNKQKKKELKQWQHQQRQKNKYIKK